MHSCMNACQKWGADRGVTCEEALHACKHESVQACMQERKHDSRNEGLHA